MPEEKKEKFTFSDKIKNSKPAGNKSFAKSSAKIGKDGKPKATLFERTRRDAPFFIAALVALLLLPFLYKYSGQASEDQLLTPGSEQTDFDPERYGFDTAMIEDPDGQIAQLAGRDSLSLIKGWGSNQEEDYGRDDMDLDASSSYEGSAEGEYAAEKHSSSDMDVEDNTTNIYKRRAGAATRAAFRRTKVGTLNPAGIRRPGGSRLGINNWGGGLKGAAKKVGPSAPASAPKPVSLQPLRAAGSRSTFGQGGAAAARKSKDNMGKADAREALRDSYVKPVGPTRTGGLDLFSMGPSGGSGKLSRNINITPGKEPWWWDMMKTRMQKEWEKEFERKWKWITFWDDLARDILKKVISPIGGALNCLIWGHEDGDMGYMFGYGEGGGVKAECCDKSESWVKDNYPDAWTSAGGDFERVCKAKKDDIARRLNKPGCGFKGGTTKGASAGGWARRKQCLGVRAKAAATIGEGTSGLSCANIDHNQYTLSTYQLPRKWQKHTYMYVVARNYRPASMPGLSTDAPRGMLCAEKDPFKIGATSSAGGSSVSLAELRQKGEELNADAKLVRHSISSSKEQEFTANLYERDPESVANGCVIYVQKGNVFNYKNFKEKVIKAFTKVVEEGGFDKDDSRSASTIAADAFDQLDLMFIEGFASKNKLAYAQWFESGNNLDDILPMVYWRFHDAFVDHKKSTHKATGSRVNVDNRRQRVWGEDSAKAPRCYFNNSLSLSCQDDTEKPQAKVVFKPNYKGGQALNMAEEAQKMVVTAQFTPLNGKAGAELNMHHGVEITSVEPKTRTVQYTLKTENIKDATGKTMEANNGKEFVGNVTWSVYRNASTQAEAHEGADSNYVLTATCTLNLFGDGHSEIVDPKPCPNGPQTSQECCEQIYGSQDLANTYKWEDGKCIITPKPQGDEYTILAPGIRCVPNGATDRKARPNTSMTEQEMCKLFGNPLVGKYTTSGQSCKDLWGFKMDSAKATAFVNRVKEAYNKAHPELPIKFDKTYPQDSEFIDALNIAPTVGISEVPMAAVCEMGRDFVRMSKDKHAGNRSIISGATGTKDEQLIFRNELGAFLAYIHDTSILYPDAFVRVKGKYYCDWRFQPYGVADGGCSKTLGPKMGKAYAHNNYNGTKFEGKYSRYFVPSLTAIMKQAPLRALANGKDYPHNCGNCKAMNGKNYVKQYNSYEGFVGLLHEETPSMNGQGIACEAFLGGNKNATMSVSDALKYIEGLCTAGLDYKPVGQGNKEYVQGQNPTSSGGQSGGDEITGQRI